MVVLRVRGEVTYQVAGLELGAQESIRMDI